MYQIIYQNKVIKAFSTKTYNSKLYQLPV